MHLNADYSPGFVECFFFSICASYFKWTARWIEKTIEWDMENNQGIFPFLANLSKIMLDLQKQNEKCSLPLILRKYFPWYTRSSNRFK